jgi:hypothetical protein
LAIFFLELLDSPMVDCGMSDGNGLPDILYQPHEGKRCEFCVHYLKPNGCKMVTGPISPQGWCRLFSANA